jgi:hypothetical protein
VKALLGVCHLNGTVEHAMNACKLQIGIQKKDLFELCLQSAGEKTQRQWHALVPLNSILESP